MNKGSLFMSPVSPVFHIVETVRTGLKTQLDSFLKLVSVQDVICPINVIS